MNSSLELFDFLKTRSEEWIAGVVEKSQLLQSIVTRNSYDKFNM